MNPDEAGSKPQRSWAENVRVRGVAILSRLVMPILYDKGDRAGRATKFGVKDIQQTPDQRFVFVLDITADAERGRLLGPGCLHLSALQILFQAALAATFQRDEQPTVFVSVWDRDRERVLSPRELTFVS
jgi:hypothetical protein